MDTSDSLKQFVGQGFNKRAWHGSNLLTSLRNVSEDEASWRPQPERHNIWELAVHAAYWKYRVYILITVEPPRKFEAKGNTWFERPAKDDASDWQEDKELLKTWHDCLTRAVDGFNPKNLEQHPGRSEYTYFDHISGIAMHDVYHAGQIKLIRKLYEAVE